MNAHPQSPDAELIALCAGFAAVEDQRRQLYDDAPDGADEDALTAKDAVLQGHQDTIITRMIAIHSTTADGVLARARAVALHAHGTVLSVEVTPSTWAGRMMAALLRDALLISGDVVPPDLLRVIEELPASWVAAGSRVNTSWAAPLGAALYVHGAFILVTHLRLTG